MPYRRTSTPARCSALLPFALWLPSLGGWAAGLAQAPSPAGQDLPSAPLPTLEAIQRSAAISSYEKRLPAGVTVAQAGEAPPSLSLEEAVSQALRHNLSVMGSEQNERRVAGLRSTVANALLPSLQFQGYTNTQEINLSARGFRAQDFASVAATLGGAAGATAFSNIVKVNVTDAQINVSQQLFNVPAYFLYRASQRASDAAQLSTLNVRGGLVLQTASQYLRILADRAEIETARALIMADEADLSSATQRHDAGVGLKLDVLRSKVQLQREQQVLISAENTYSKDRIALNRSMGAPAGQEFTLTDTVPYAELAALSQPDALQLALTKRKDYLTLLSQMEVAGKTARAVRYERLPTLALSGYYGVIGETTGLYHGVFAAQGSLNFPIFKEAQFRGEREVASAETEGVRRQIASLRETIDQDIRAAMLDVETARQAVEVARSNVDLSRQVLADARDRFTAGVQDNLPVSDAQASLASAESGFTEGLYQYNLSKLQLARSIGVTESQYLVYLGR